MLKQDVKQNTSCSLSVPKRPASSTVFTETGDSLCSIWWHLFDRHTLCCCFEVMAIILNYPARKPFAELGCLVFRCDARCHLQVHNDRRHRSSLAKLNRPVCEEDLVHSCAKFVRWILQSPLSQENWRQAPFRFCVSVNKIPFLQVYSVLWVNFITRYCSIVSSL